MGTNTRIGINLGAAALIVALALAGCAREAASPPERPAESAIAAVRGAIAADTASMRSPATAAAKRFDARTASMIGGIAGSSLEAQPPPSPPPVAGPVVPSRDRKVIRNGSLGLEVTSVDEALEAIQSFTGSVGGYIANQSHAQREYGVRSATITCRLPAGQLDAAVGRFRRLGKEETLSLEAEDISEQYFNLEIRLRNQQQLEARLVDLMNRSTNRLTDLLEIEKEVARVRGEIDELEGRKRFWDSQVAFSTLTVTVHEPRPVVASEAGGPWRTLTNAFGNAGDNLVLTVAGMIAALGTLVPLGVVLLVLVVVSRIVWKRWHHAPDRSTPQVAAPAPRA